MITDDDVMRIFEQADPARLPDRANHHLDGAGYLDALRRRSTDVTLIESDRPDTEPTDHRWRWIAAAAATIALVVGGLVVLTDSESEPTPADTVAPTTVPDAATPTTAPATVPATTAPTTESASPAVEDPAVLEALETASQFMDGFAGRDIAVIEETAVEGQVRGLLVGNFDTLRTEFEWLDAIGWSMTVDECVAFDTDIDPERPRVRCDVVIDNAWSRALGTGPYEAEFFVSLTPPGGTYGIAGPFDRWTVTERLSEQFPRTEFEQEAWAPFVDWLEANHPDDLAIMFNDTLDGELHVFAAIPALTPESIELWQSHTDSFVGEVTASTT